MISFIGRIVGTSSSTPERKLGYGRDGSE